MIRELRAKNIALIDEARIELTAGLSVFTGETGAGKSILIGAIGLILGERASSEIIRNGFDEAEVQALFECEQRTRATLDPLLAESGITLEGDELIIRRVLSRSGKNRIYVNDMPVTQSLLKQIGDLLVDFHGQHEHQSLLDPEQHRDIIDALPGVSLARNAYDVAWHAYIGALHELEEHTRRAAELAERRDLLEFQYQELKELDLHSDDEEKLSTELALVSSVAQRAETAGKCISLLTSDEAAPGALLFTVRKHLDSLTKIDQTVAQWLPDLDSALTTIRELERFLASYADTVASGADPARLEAINTRLARIQRFKKKHGCDGAGLVAKTEQLASDLAAIVNATDDEAQLTRKRDRALNECNSAGSSLTAARKKAIKPFDAAIGKKMITLGLSGGKWESRLISHSAPQPFGCDDIEFYVQSNPGEPALPLVKTASGGEVSRLMLAIKTVMATSDKVGVLVFDEIDTGIGGMIAHEVAQAMRDLAQSHQVLCISHLHQIAAVADSHLHVFKDEQAGRTVTHVKTLNATERVDEIARMLGGESDIARKHARELLGKR